MEAHRVLLERHQLRREANQATLSVLVGPLGICLRAYRDWATNRQYKLLVTSSKAINRLFDDLIEWWFQNGDPVADAIAGLGMTDSSGLREQFRGMSFIDYATWRESLFSALPVSVKSQIYSAILERVLNSKQSAQQFATCFQLLERSTQIQRIATVLELIQEPRLALFVSVDSEMKTRDPQVEIGLRLIHQLAEQVPNLPIAIFGSSAFLSSDCWKIAILEWKLYCVKESFVSKAKRHNKFGTSYHRQLLIGYRKR